MFVGFCVVFCIYEDILRTWFWHFSKNVPEVWTIFVRSILGKCLGLLGSYMVPPAHPRRKYQSLWKNVLLLKFCDFCEKWKDVTKTITSCSIRRVGQIHISSRIEAFVGSVLNTFVEVSKFRKQVFCHFLVQMKGWDGRYREETKLVCPISRSLIFDWKT